MTTTTTYHDLALPSGIKVHYASAGAPTAPPLLLLHGFPATSSQFRTLIPLLSATHRVIAPDLPGFGHTVLPAGTTPSFDLMASTVGELLDALHVTRTAVYIFDYGSPTAFRLALKRPTLFSAIITQNGNAYEAGLGADFWAPLRSWWDGGDEHVSIRSVLYDVIGDINWTKGQYYDGVPAQLVDRIDPQTYTLDYLQHLASAEARETQLKLFWDYGNNVKMYPQFHAYLREQQPRVLAVWGKGDPCFVPAGAEAFKKDVPGARIELLDGGHFLLETHVSEVAQLILEFLKGEKH